MTFVTAGHDCEVSIGYHPCQQGYNRSYIPLGRDISYSYHVQAILTWGVSRRCQQNVSGALSQLWLTQNPPDHWDQAAI